MDLNKRREELMSWVTGAMVTREKTLRRSRRLYAKAIMTVGDRAFVAWHKTRNMWIKKEAGRRIQKLEDEEGAEICGVYFEIISR